MSPPPFVDQLNRASPAEFMAAIGGVVEHSPWVAEQALARRPFARPSDVHAALTAAIDTASGEQKLALIRAHPELAGQEARAGTMTTSSTTEQGRLGLTQLSLANATRLTDLNRTYRDRFGFPCIIALKLHDTLDSVLATFGQRVASTRDAEVQVAIEQIGHVVRGRLARQFGMEGGRLSTHVLDTVTGQPGAGMQLDLYAFEGDGWRHLRREATNAQGRTDRPLLSDIDVAPGRYLIEFQAGTYFRARDMPLSDPPFIDVVPLQFGIASATAHYHVPLLCSPWSYTTYRGS